MRESYTVITLKNRKGMEIMTSAEKNTEIKKTEWIITGTAGRKTECF